MLSDKKEKVLMYYTYGDRIGGPLTYLRSIMNSELNEKYDFVTCFQNMAPGGVNFPLLFRMVKQIKAEAPDIVHIHGLQSEGFYGVLAAKLAGCRKIVTTVHGFAFDGQNKHGIKWFLYKYVVEPLTLRLSNKVYCVCNYAAKRDIVVKNTRKNGCGYIHNAVGELHTTQSREAVRTRLSIAPEETVFVISGRISQAKGFDILAETVKLLNERGIGSFRLMVLGDGEYAQTFSETMHKEIEAGQVLMLGHTERIADYLNAADVCVLPSYHENLPIALLEAGKMGLPCIVSDAGGIPEIIQDGKTGYIIEDYSAKTYAEKMEWLMSLVGLRRSMSEAIRFDMEDRFSMSTMCRKIEEVYVNAGGK